MSRRLALGAIGCREIDRNGYVRVYAPDHPWQRGRMLSEHVLIMERSMGRRIAADECVHHIDGDKSNNNLSNLELLKRGDHSRHHRLAEDPASRRHPRKLTTESARRIKRRLRNGETQRRIARDFGVSQTTISAIARGKTWSHVD